MRNEFLLLAALVNGLRYVPILVFHLPVLAAQCLKYHVHRKNLVLQERISRLEEANAMALAGDFPDVDNTDKGVKITPLENSAPSEVSPFADMVYGMLPHPKITEIPEEGDSRTGFTRHFAQLKKLTSDQKTPRLRYALCSLQASTGPERRACLKAPKMC